MSTRIARDPSVSPDPVIRRVALRRSAVAAEIRRLDSLIEVYAAQVKPTPVRMSVPPIEHYGMLDSEDCGCEICTDWTARRAEFVAAIPLMPKGHKWSLCACDACRFVASMHTGFLAATNRRDLLIETAYHARHSTKYGTQVMNWLGGELQRTKADVKWSAQELSRQPMQHWLKKCEAVVGPAVSGIVFRT